MAETLYTAEQRIAHGWTNTEDSRIIMADKKILSSLPHATTHHNATWRCAFVQETLPAYPSTQVYRQPLDATMTA
jgi:hypothetical protein